MLARVDLAAALNSIPLARVNGTWWRAVPHHLLKGPPPGAPPGSPPQPLWPDGSALSGARYTPKGGPRTVYLASDPATALQEVNAIFAIPNGPSIALPAAPYTMCQVNVVLNDVLDLSVPSIEAWVRSASTSSRRLRIVAILFAIETLRALAIAFSVIMRLKLKGPPPLAPRGPS